MEAKLTPEQREFARQGKVREFWESRLESGDSIARLALNILDNTGVGRLTNERLLDFAEDYGVGVKLEEVSLRLMRAHTEATATDSDGLLRAEVIAKYHHEVFKEYGLPARTFGGTPLFGALWEADIPYAWLRGYSHWCEACPEE